MSGQSMFSLIRLTMGELNVYSNVSNFPCQDIRLMLLEAHSLMTIAFSLVFDSVILLTGILLFVPIWLLCHAYIDHLEEHHQSFAEQYHSDIRIFVFQRYISIFLYVFGAIKWNRLAGTVGFTSVWLVRWSMEATLDVPTIVFTLWTPFDEASYNSADQFYLYFINGLLLYCKLNHFRFLRYAEGTPRLWTNRLVITSFNYLCQDSHRSSPLTNAPVVSSSNPCDCKDFIERLNITAVFF